jgi:hypothetical protein
MQFLDVYNFHFLRALNFHDLKTAAVALLRRLAKIGWRLEGGWRICLPSSGNYGATTALLLGQTTSFATDAAMLRALTGLGS